jgi:AcrR family transcriptional regulator
MSTSEEPARRRRAEPLTAARIVGAAVVILDEGGQEALTARSLASALRTGAGAIYHHLGSKQAILAAAAADLIGRAVAMPHRSDDPEADLRAVMRVLFDVIDAHPWVGAQLTDQPGQPALLEMLEAIGAHLVRLGVAHPAQFTAATALVNYVLGVASQYAAAARAAPDGGRSELLGRVADDWAGEGRAADHPFVHRHRIQLADHDEREQYAVGVDILLAGITGLPRA